MSATTTAVDRAASSGSAPPPFQQFLDAQREAVWRFLVARVGAADAEDCFQETFIAALRAYPQLRRGSNLRAWVLTIAEHKAFDMYRARGRRAVPVAAPEELDTDDERSPSAEQLLLAREQALWEAVGALPERQRSAVVLRYVADLPHGAIAAAMDCSPEAARRSLHEGLSKLRKVVER